MPLLIPVPLILALVLGQRIKKWQVSGDITAPASEQARTLIGAVLLVTYSIFMELASAR
jgi:hypothetical protein